MDSKTAERIRNSRDAHNSFIRTLRSKEKAYSRRKTGAHFQDRIFLTKARGTTEWATLEVPPILCLDDHYENTVGLIRALRRLALKERRPVRLLFENVKAIKASALLLLLAEIHRCRIVRGSHLVTGTYPKDPKLERMLCAMGFFDILKVRSRVTVKQTYPMNYIKFASADKLKEHQARQLRADLLGDKIEMQVIPRKKLQRAITEAMLNAVQHAYPKNAAKNHPGRNRWWLSGTYNRRTKDLTIMFCDLGVGIPATITKLYLMERIRAAVSLLPGIQISHGQLITAAMTLGRTRTGNQGRGKGLNDLRKFIDQANSGELKIYSGKGSYTYHAGGKEESDNYEQSIGGTLIKWRVPIANVTDWSGEDDVDDEN
jgi:hypothetical protein